MKFVLEQKIPADELSSYTDTDNVIIVDASLLSMQKTQWYLLIDNINYTVFFMYKPEMFDRGISKHFRILEFATNTNWTTFKVVYYDPKIKEDENEGFEVKYNKATKEFF